MKCAPVVLPALGELLRRDVEPLPQQVLARLVGIDREAVADVLDALREEIEQ
jgi:hypothetical protein